MAMELCPSCRSKVEVDGSARASEIVDCPECGSVLEVVSTNPFALALAPDVAEDWGE
jgi:alpha-aminoadipate/glutamate carrier protein LysW